MAALVFAGLGLQLECSVLPDRNATDARRLRGAGFRNGSRRGDSTGRECPSESAPCPSAETGLDTADPSQETRRLRCSGSPRQHRTAMAVRAKHRPATPRGGEGGGEKHARRAPLQKKRKGAPLPPHLGVPGRAVLPALARARLWTRKQRHIRIEPAPAGSRPEKRRWRLRSRLRPPPAHRRSALQ